MGPTSPEIVSYVPCVVGMCSAHRNTFFKQHIIILVFLVILFKYNFLVCPHPRDTAAQLQGVPFNCSGFVSSHSIPPRGTRP